MDSPPSEPERQSWSRRLLQVLAAALRLLGRRSTWKTVAGAADFLLSNEIYTYASAIAFNALIALFPAAIVALTLVNQWGGPALHDEMLKAIVEFIPANKTFFSEQIRGVTRNFSGMTVVSLGILLFSAVGIFVPVELALNYVWKEPRPRHWAASQALSFLLLAILILLAIVPVYLTLQFDLALGSVLGLFRDSLVTRVVPWSAFEAVNEFFSWVVLKALALPFTVLAFALLYGILPQHKLTLEQILPAALFAGIGFEVGRQVYALCLPLLDLREMYGAFSVSVAFITWALFASMLALMGAWLTAQDLLPRVRWAIPRPFGRGARVPGSSEPPTGGVPPGPVAPPGGGR